MKKLDAGNLIAGLRSNTLITGLFVILVVSIVLLFANFFYLGQQAGYDKVYLSQTGDLRVVSQQISKAATEAAAGKADAFKVLKAARDDFEKGWGLAVSYTHLTLPTIYSV